MTAEIAILNRRAVALSADSAVTISQTGKIYNSADKIFELSTHDPIGLMVYNNLDFMGIPLDVIIKSFRETEAKGRRFDNVFVAASVFFNFLHNNFEISEEAEHSHIEDLIYDDLLNLQSRIQRAIATQFARGMQGMRTVNIDLGGIFQNALNLQLATIRQVPENDCFFDVSLEQIVDRYSHIIDPLLPMLLPVDAIIDAHRTTLRTLVAMVLQRNRFSTNHTGLVFAGYGPQELFPSLVS